MSAKGDESQRSGHRIYYALPRPASIRVSVEMGAPRPSCWNTMGIYALRYEWEGSKNLLNQRKHDGVSFELAALVFDDERCLVGPDRVDSRTGEQRWHAIGAVQIELGAAAILLVVHAYREDNHGEETIRIISARGAQDREIRRYREQAMD